MRFSGVAAAVFAVAAAAGVAVFADSPNVPLNVKIPVVLTKQVSSGTANVGDEFFFKTVKEEKLGDVDVPAGTPGSGRLADVQPAHGKQHGNLALQADSINLADGSVLWVNIDTSQPPMGHLSKHKNVPFILPVPGAIFPGVIQSSSGDMVLDVGTKFAVYTIAPRVAPAPLLTAPPTPPPTPAPEPSSEASSVPPAPLASPVGTPT